MITLVNLVYSRQTLLQYPAVEGHIKKLNDVVEPSVKSTLNDEVHPLEPQM